jgi:hypothetical protein
MEFSSFQSGRRGNQVVAAQKREANKQARRTIYFAIREDIAKVEAQEPYTWLAKAQGLDDRITLLPGREKVYCHLELPGLLGPSTQLKGIEMVQLRKQTGIPRNTSFMFESENLQTVVDAVKADMDQYVAVAMARNESYQTAWMWKPQGRQVIAEGSFEGSFWMRKEFTWWSVYSHEVD